MLINNGTKKIKRGTLTSIADIQCSNNYNIHVFKGSLSPNDILLKYGADSYISRCACVILGCSETIFYVTAVYTSKTNIKKLLYAIPIALVCALVGSAL